jgi:hypothetical protein
VRCSHTVARSHLLLNSKLDAINQVMEREWSKMSVSVFQPRVMRMPLHVE